MGWSRIGTTVAPPKRHRDRRSHDLSRLSMSIFIVGCFTFYRLCFRYSGSNLILPEQKGRIFTPIPSQTQLAQLAAKLFQNVLQHAQAVIRSAHSARTPLLVLLRSCGGIVVCKGCAVGASSRSTRYGLGGSSRPMVERT
ncbi:hypothetical protein FRC12_013370 [Ceratobasidium sp. 428]|nr:hypothetical protein FRC12_013370 [Ceratobasidium sp. 428]